jgi:hypothetical protein
MTTQPNAEKLPQTLKEIREVTAPHFKSKFTHSVNIRASFGDVVVFRDGTIKLWSDCKELH